MKLLELALCLGTALAWTVQDGRVNVKGRGDLGEDIPFTLDAPILLTKNKVLEVGFTIADSQQDTSKDGRTTKHLPRQIMLLVTSPTGEESHFAFKVRGDKAKLTLPHGHLPTTTAKEPLLAEILMGGPSGKPVRESGFKLVVSGSAAEAKNQAAKPLFHGKTPLSYEPLPEIHHQFSSPHKTVPAIIALISSAAVFGLLFGLFGVWAKYCGLHFGGLETVAAVGSMEAVFLAYYVGLSVFSAIAFAALLSPVIYLVLRWQLRKECASPISQPTAKLQ